MAHYNLFYSSIIRLFYYGITVVAASIRALLSRRSRTISQLSLTAAQWSGVLRLWSRLELGVGFGIGRGYDRCVEDVRGFL